MCHFSAEKVRSPSSSGGMFSSIRNYNFFFNHLPSDFYSPFIEFRCIVNFSSHGAGELTAKDTLYHTAFAETHEIEPFTLSLYQEENPDMSRPDPSTEYLIEDVHKDTPFYAEFMAGKEHTNLIGTNEEGGTPDFPVILSLELPGTDDKKGYLRTKKGNFRYIIPNAFTSSVKEMIRFTKNLYPDVANVKFVESSSGQLVDKLVEYEQQGAVKRYKFGVLYMRDGQTTDDEMYTNTETSQEYEEFLKLLGDRVSLQGWTGFRGGLDVKANTTGSESIVATMEDFKIMYHVSTLLPFQPDDLQRVERKRHLGNDVVVVIFKEGKKAFNPLVMKSHFNHVFIVVQRGSDRKYHVEVANKPGVRTYGPYVPFPARFEGGSKFREWLLSKMINAERACMQAPEFKGKMIRTAKELLGEM
ncbi:RapGAP/RanGAP domain-containing protein, partial [Planoprotostelium fungivorum]